MHHLETFESSFQCLFHKVLRGLWEQIEVLVTDKIDIILEFSEVCVASFVKDQQLALKY